MKIQCILERNGGSRINLGGLEYHFEPLEDGAHVAEVTIEEHIDRFLSIAESFRVYHGNGSPKGMPIQVGELSPVALRGEDKEPSRLRLMGSDAHPPSFEIAGKPYSQFEIVKIAFDASNMTEDEWNELSAEDRAARIDMALDDLDEAAAGNDNAPAKAQTEAEAANEAKPAKGGKRTTKKAA